MKMKKKLKVFFLTISLVSVFLASLVSKSMADSPIIWHGFKGDSGHTGYTDQKMDRKLGLQWRFFFSGDYIEPIQVFSDNVYFLDRNCFLYSVKREDSSVNYKKSVATNRSIIGLDASDKYIYVVTGPSFSRDRRNPGEMACIISAWDREKGEKIWENKYPTMMATSPVVIGDTVYFATGLLDPNNTKTVGGDIYFLNGSNGSEINVTHIEEYAFGMGRGYITIAEEILLITGMKFDRSTRNQSPPKLFAINTKTGSQLWAETPLDENKTFGIPAIKGGFVYLMENPAGGGFGGGGGPPGGGGPGGGRQKPEAWLLKIELKTGKNVKTMNIQNENFGNFSPTLAKDAIYINSFTGKIFCISYEMDKIYWTKTYDRFSFYTELTATQNYLYTCLYDGTFLCISKEDGTIQYRYTIGNYGGIPVVSNSEVFVSGEALYCFSLNAKPLLLTEPSSLDFKTLEKGIKKQISFRILYTGIESLEGTVISSVPWLTIKPDKIVGNIQTFFALIDSSKVPDGKQNCEIQINTNFGKKIISVSVEIKVPLPLPLTINIKENLIITNKNRFILTGTTDPLTKVLINGLEQFSDNRGQFSQGLFLHEGKNPIQVEAISKDNRKAYFKSVIQLDTVPPGLEAIFTREEMNGLIRGKTETGALIVMGDQTFTPSPDGSFEIQIPLTVDQTEIILSAKDSAGNITSKIFNIQGE